MAPAPNPTMATDAPKLQHIALSASRTAQHRALAIQSLDPAQSGSGGDVLEYDMEKTPPFDEASPGLPVLTITLNPAVDLATSTPDVRPGPKLRCTPPLIDPGGGGVNVARTIGRLGGRTQALVVTGGVTGDQLLALLEAEGINTIPVRVAGETRQNFAVTDSATGAQYRFGLPGAELGDNDITAVLDTIAANTVQGGIVVLSGSLAPGLDTGFPQQINGLVTQAGARFAVDTSGAALAELIAYPTTPLYLLRIDQNEARQAANSRLTHVRDSIYFAQSLVARGVAEMIVTGRGPEGSILVTRDEHCFCTAPEVRVNSKIGAGDAFVGALVLSLSRGLSPAEALRRGVAASGATVTTQGTALCSLEDVERLLRQCRLQEPPAR
ncbi:MAG: 1-phosphofructokinase family hexose kinase [Litoreibacter sp.]|nr:1-phosphofructokinase family hexose kinase [Litoreibacter sp.]